MLHDILIGTFITVYFAIVFFFYHFLFNSGYWVDEAWDVLQSLFWPVSVPIRLAADLGKRLKRKK